MGTPGQGINFFLQFVNFIYFYITNKVNEYDICETAKTIDPCKFDEPSESKV